MWLWNGAGFRAVIDRLAAALIFSMNTAKSPFEWKRQCSVSLCSYPILLLSHRESDKLRSFVFTVCYSDNASRRSRGHYLTRVRAQLKVFGFYSPCLHKYVHIYKYRYISIDISISISLYIYVDIIYCIYIVQTMCASEENLLTFPNSNAADGSNGPPYSEWWDCRMLSSGAVSIASKWNVTTDTTLLVSCWMIWPYFLQT